MRTVTVHVAADRHTDLHDRAFGSTSMVTVEPTRLDEAVVKALADLDLGAVEGKCLITVDWFHDAE